MNLRQFKEKWNNRKKDYAAEFSLHIEDIMENEKVVELDNFVQHFGTTRLRHSMEVAYASFVIAKFFGWDARSTARGGMLHDLYFYDKDGEEYKETGYRHFSHHPSVALENANEIFDLNEIEQNIILRHMWLATLTPPKFKEGFIVTFVDKVCAVREFYFAKIKRNSVLRSAFTQK